MFGIVTIGKLKELIMETRTTVVLRYLARAKLINTIQIGLPNRNSGQCGDRICDAGSYCQYLDETKTLGTCTRYLHAYYHNSSVWNKDTSHSKAFHDKHPALGCGQTNGFYDRTSYYCVDDYHSSNSRDTSKYPAYHSSYNGRHYRCNTYAPCDDGTVFEYDNPIFGGHLPLAVVACDDAIADKACESIQGDGKSSYNAGRWSTPGQEFCNTCKEGYEPTDLDRYKLLSPDYVPTEHIECSPCLYNEGKYSDTAGLQQCKNMNGCSRGHKFVHQSVMSYTLLREYTKQKDVKFDFEGNTQRNAYQLKFEFPEYVRDTSPHLDLGGCSMPQGYFSEITDLDEDCKPKTKQCIGSYGPTCARTAD